MISRAGLHCTAGISFWRPAVSTFKPSEWKKAVSDAEKIVGYSTSFMSLRCLLSDELSNVAMHMRKLVGTRHPLLKTARKLFYDGKQSMMQTRGLLVLLMSKAAGPSPPEANFLEVSISGIYPSQRSLAEITEMIHTASLIHKGVVNLTGLQPSIDGPMQDMEFGNKIAVLSGDFLLANASTGLASLNNTSVVELISSAICDLMKAEFTKLRDSRGHCVLPAEGATIEDWEQQTFLSSGSLLAKSCKAALKLASHSPELQERAFEFGKQIAYAQKLNEDIQDITNPKDDLSPLDLASAPAILYVSQHANDSYLHSLLRQCSSSNEKILKLLKNNRSVIKESRQLCKEYGQKAIQSLDAFESSEAKSALTNIVKAVTNV